MNVLHCVCYVMYFMLTFLVCKEIFFFLNVEWLYERLFYTVHTFFGGKTLIAKNAN